MKAMALSAEDSVAFAFAHNSEGEVILVSELGYMKRCLLIDFDRQARGGKGVRSFAFLKNGSNGSRVAGALMVTDPCDFRIVQKSGAVDAGSTPRTSPSSPRPGGGTPYVVVVLDDVVTELQSCNDQVNASKAFALSSKEERPREITLSRALL